MAAAAASAAAAVAGAATADAGAHAVTTTTITTDTTVVATTAATTTSVPADDATSVATGVVTGAAASDGTTASTTPTPTTATPTTPTTTMPATEGADAAREAGNVAAKVGSWEKAARHYTVAIAAAPGDARGWCNRSLAYLELDKPLLAWSDATDAADSGTALAMKAQFRLAAAYEAMKLFDYAAATYRAMSTIDEARVRLAAAAVAKAQWEAGVLKIEAHDGAHKRGRELEAFKALMLMVRKGGMVPLTGKFRGGVDRDPAAVIAAFAPYLTTGAVVLRALPGRGVGIVATRDLPAGTAVHVETPLLAATIGPACYHCLRTLREGMGVPCACDRVFCSSACKAAAQAAYHAPLCAAAGGRAVAVLEAGAEIGMATATRYISLMWKLLGAAMVHAQATGTPLRPPPDTAPFCHLARVTDWATPTSGEAQPLFMVAQIMVIGCTQLRDLTGMRGKPALSAEWLCDAAAMVKSNIMVLHSSTPTHASRRGQALMGAGSFFNHSCVPNTMNISNMETTGATVTFTTVRAVKKGEELTISYLDEGAPVAERRAALRKHYGFTCTCPKCVTETTLAAPPDEPLATNMLIMW